MEAKLKAVFEQYKIHNGKGELIPILETELGKELFSEVIEIKEDEHVALSLGLHYDKSRMQWITIEATKFDDDHVTPTSWAIRQGGFVMSKLTGSFDYEPMPSNRDDEFFAEYRFESPEEATECWNKFQV
ncbi:MAG: hypothetical protein AABY15_03065 [Nanoarchaeota archaeon]